MPRLPLIIAVLVILVYQTAAPSVRAGDPFTIQNNLNGLDHEGERIRALRIPIDITLRSWQDHPYGLRLRLAATFATTDLFELLDGGFEVVRVNSFMPGLEFVVPWGPDHLLRPHLDVGAGRESATDKTVFLAALGLRTEFVFAGDHFFAGLEPGFKLNNRSGEGLENRSTFSPFMKVSGRRVLGFLIDGHQPDAGVFFETGYDFNALELTTVRSTRDAVNTNLEIGVGFGFSQSRPKVAFFRWPRIRVGYRLGDIQGWRLRIGGDWLNTVRGLSRPRAGG